MCPRVKDPTVSQRVMTLPQSQAWYPSSFHCEQGQKVGLLGSVPLDLRNGYQMGYVLPSPRSRGESLVQPYPTRSQMGPPFHLHQDSWHPQLPPHLGVSERGVSLATSPPPAMKRNCLGLEADAALHYSNVFHGASGAPLSPGSPFSCW